jgi:membrane fusion protein (multidrug efflux system)
MISSRLSGDVDLIAHRRPLLTTALVLQLLAALVSFPAPVIAQASPATAVFVTEVQSTTIEDRIEALGTLRANESVELTTSVTETVTELHFDDGDRVKAGQILVDMSSGEERAQLEEARATVAEAQRQYQRIKSLQATQTAAESLLDQRHRELETGRARLVAIESRLADRQVRAPFSGVIGLRNVSVGALVEPGDIIATLDDDSVMKLDFSVPAIYLNVLMPDVAVIATSRTWEGRRFEGTVKSIDSRVDPVTRTIIVRALLSNPDRLLRPGMLMQVELLNRQREALMIPEESLLSLGDRQFVLVVDKAADNSVERREVQIGTRRPGEVEIVSGLTSGEQVITDGTLKVRAGSNVTIRAFDNGTTPISELLNTKPADRNSP